MRFRDWLVGVTAGVFVAALLISGGSDPVPPTIGMDVRVEYVALPSALAVGETAGGAKFMDAFYWGELERVALEERAREEAERARSLNRPTGRSGGRSSGGSCGDGFAIPGEIVWTESRCDYGAYNASGCDGQGCYGAYQIHAMHYRAGGACAGLSQSPADQDACAGRLSGGGSNLGAWGG